MNKAVFCGMLSAMTAFQLPSCQFNANVETLLSPPRLTEEQEKIYQALQAAASGQSVSLKYPKSGTRLSAFLVEDFDSDGADEAIVFYESNRSAADGNPLRIGLLDQKNGAWSPVTEYTTAGKEVERVDVECLGSDPKKNLIISYSMVDGAEHTAEVFQYINGTLQQIRSVPFSILSISDLNADGEKELFVAAAAKQPFPATATVYSLTSEGWNPPAEVSLPESFSDVTRMSSGLMPMHGSHVPAIYLDGASGATMVQTAVLVYADGKLSLEYADSADRPFSTSRASGCQAMDIDNDGEIEIPVQSEFYGYNTEAGAPAITMTSWYVCRGGQLMRKCASYYAVQNSYVFLMPSRWERKVTAAPESEEIVFYEYEKDMNAADGTPVKKTELLRLAVVSDPAAAEAMEQDDYLLLRRKYGNYYMAKCTEKDHPLAITDSELILSMRIL